MLRRAEAPTWAAALVTAGAIWALANLAGCGSATPPEPSHDEVADGRQEIRELSLQIRDWRARGGMEPAPQSHVIRATHSESVHALRACPTAPETDRCQDVCALKDAICDNAERICGIARAIGNDPWSAKRCKSAKASCKEASERCCACIADENRRHAP